MTVGKAYEYKELSASGNLHGDFASLSHLQELGAQGWHVVSITPNSTRVLLDYHPGPGEVLYEHVLLKREVAGPGSREG